MPGPSWPHVALAALMLLLAVSSTARLIVGWLRGRRPELASGGVHAAMGVAMAGMLLPTLGVLPAAAWAVVFGCAATWFGWRAIGARRRKVRSGASDAPHDAPLAHVVECLAMIFMLLPSAGLAAGGPTARRAMTGMTAMARPPLAGTFGVLALLLALCLAGYVIWAADKLVRARGTAAADGAFTLRFVSGGGIAMSVAMMYMLMQMA
jgi:hypothetical protein